MLTFRTFMLVIFFAVASISQVAAAEDINLQPKYGLTQKNETERAADAKFLASIDDYYKGNRKKAAEEVSARGWTLLRQGNASDAMRRFNQAWLIDNANGSAIWGMAAIQAGSSKIAVSLKLFEEAEKIIGNDIDFSVDYARALGTAAAQTKNDSQLKDALNRFGHLYEKAPQHTLNLQNWAITLFYIGNYAEAWKKVKLAEATPRHGEIDQNFLAALQSKMPRP
ncbi:MAG: hypothetical protein HGA96_03770 [Desulfobulbaceae bacterium]|nr:hypothetical protein [Desulfobulbaceae bacterium]